MHHSPSSTNQTHVENKKCHTVYRFQEMLPYCHCRLVLETMMQACHQNNQVKAAGNVGQLCCMGHKIILLHNICCSASASDAAVSVYCALSTVHRLQDQQKKERKKIKNNNGHKILLTTAAENSGVSANHIISRSSPPHKTHLHPQQSTECRQAAASHCTTTEGGAELLNAAGHKL